MVPIILSTVSMIRESHISNRNEKFADVILFSSHTDNDAGIPAHKFVLSSCSQVIIENVLIRFLSTINI